MDTIRLALQAERARLARAGQSPAVTNSQRIRELERYIKEIGDLKARVEALEERMEIEARLEPER